MRPTRTGSVFLLTLLVAGFTSGRAQEQLYSFPAAVSYISSGTVYINAGTSAGLAAGDTIVVLHKPAIRLPLVIAAVSSGSSSAPYAGKLSDIAVGDSVFVYKPIVPPAPKKEQTVSVPSDTTAKRNPASGLALAPSRSSGPDFSAIHGRVAVQYVGAGQLKGVMNFSQPSLLLQLSSQKLFGSGLTFNFYGRSYYDFSPQFGLYGTGRRMKLRLYQMTLSSGGGNGLGFDAGRLTSRYAGGLGIVDGAQVFMRQGNLTGGVLVGTQPDYTTSSLDVSQQRGVLFVNYAWGEMFQRRTDVTLAYGQQLHEGRFDRDFLYVQGSSQFGSQLMIYESSEIDLHKITNGVKSGAFDLTNTFVTVSYMPNDWLTVNGGYDATRAIYLFDSMKSIADSLINRELQQGFRGGLSVRLPLHLTASLDGTFRMKTADTRESKSIGGSLRSYSIMGTPLSMGGRYSRILGAYTDGKDISVDADYWLSGSISLNARIEQYLYTLVGTAQDFRTTTLTGMVNWSITRRWYTMVSFDQVWDTTLNSQRVFFELGLRF